MAYKTTIEPSSDYRHNYLIINDSEGERRYSDQGEPEDNSFYRDYKWIELELKNAYLQGREDRGNELYFGR